MVKKQCSVIKFLQLNKSSKHFHDAYATHAFRQQLEDDNNNIKNFDTQSPSSSSSSGK